MRKRSKRYKECEKEVTKDKYYKIEDAVTILKSMKQVKFDESVEVALKLGVDPKKSDQLVRGAYSLPHGTGKELKIIVFAGEDSAEKAKNAGAFEAGNQELIKKVKGGWLDFDVAIASPELMGEVGKLGKILGPQGKMPTPKSGTVTKDVETAVKEFMAGKIELKTDSGGNLHGLVGKLSFSENALKENIEGFVKHIISLRPTSVKGTFLLNASVSSTMGPGLMIGI